MRITNHQRLEDFAHFSFKSGSILHTQVTMACDANDQRQWSILSILISSHRRKFLKSYLAERQTSVEMLRKTVQLILYWKHSSTQYFETSSSKSISPLKKYP